MLTVFFVSLSYCLLLINNSNSCSDIAGSAKKFHYWFVKLLTVQAIKGTCSIIGVNGLPKFKNFHKKSLMVYEIGFTAQAIIKLQKYLILLKFHHVNGEGELKATFKIFVVASFKQFWLKKLKLPLKNPSISFSFLTVIFFQKCIIRFVKN